MTRNDIIFVSLIVFLLLCIICGDYVIRKIQNTRLYIWWEDRRIEKRERQLEAQNVYWDYYLHTGHTLDEEVEQRKIKTETDMFRL